MSSTRQIWGMAPGNPGYLNKETPRPRGKQPPDGIIWAHNPDDLYHVMPCDELWSRSMIEELEGTLPCDEEEDLRAPEPSPCRLDPWSPPNLYLSSKDETRNVEAPLPENGREPGGVKIEAASEGASVYRLQQHIRKEDLPDIIIINDPCEKLSGLIRSPRATTQKYMRVLPTRNLDKVSSAATTSSVPPGSPETGAIPTTARVAEMDLTGDFGHGNHSSVSRATIKFPSLASPVSVAVKIASVGNEESKMLEHEARIYDTFCQHLSEDWSGYHHMEEALKILKPFMDSVPAYSGNGMVPVKALVPKFYGYHVPIMDGLSEAEKPAYWAPKPRIVLEDCGKPINGCVLTPEQSTEFYTMVFRLLAAGYVQNSMYSRNVLVQPGPLTEPPHKRSKDTPSFRIIDFGRCERRDDFRLEISAINQWEEMVEYETLKAQVTVYNWG